MHGVQVQGTTSLLEVGQRDGNRVTSYINYFYSFALAKKDNVLRCAFVIYLTTTLSVSTNFCNLSTYHYQVKQELKFITSLCTLKLCNRLLQLSLYQ